MLSISTVTDRTPRKSRHGPMKLILTLAKIDHLTLRNDGVSHYNLLLDTAQQPVDKKAVNDKLCHIDYRTSDQSNC
jgi:hypothetical protein